MFIQNHGTSNLTKIGNIVKQMNFLKDCLDGFYNLKYVCILEMLCHLFTFTPRFCCGKIWNVLSMQQLGLGDILFFFFMEQEAIGLILLDCDL
jgi:hypothetical protein